MRNLDFKKEINFITDFIQKQTEIAGFSNIIVGLSGGIDSAVTAALSVEALGKDHVFGLMLPYRKSHPNSLRHAKELCSMLGIEYQIIDISAMVDVYFNMNDPQANLMRRGNKMARERMSILYDFSSKKNALVAGTGNKSELLVGYCTQYGDNACAFEPIGHLYKSEVRKLAELLPIPDSIKKKAPTADLWENQTDEEEMGISYEKLDKILYGLFDQNANYEKLETMGFSKKEINLVKNMYETSAFKRNLPPIPCKE